MSSKNSFTSAQPRVKLWIRLTLILLAVVFLVVGALSLYNARATNLYNQASASLESNLKAAARPNVEIDKLLHSQQEVDTMFHNAKQGSFLLIPVTKKSIAHNAALSLQLTQALSKQSSNQKDPNKKTHDSTGSKQQTGNKGGLTEEQRQQVEEMLKRNQELQNNNQQPSAPATVKPNQDNPKPW